MSASKATCFVMASDYQRYWEPSVTHPVVPQVWNGEERRMATDDRRAGLHERRWEQSRGRRFRLSDRRKS